MINIQEALPIIVAICAIISTYYMFYSKSKCILDPKVFKNFKLIDKKPVSHNTALYRFELPRPDDVLGLPAGQHLAIMAEINGKKISRSYTPISPEESRGYFDLVIKSYATGNISKLMDELKVGDSIGMRGPKGNFEYKRNMVKSIGMVAGGTGITPMLQIIRRICGDPLDKTTVQLIFANVTEDDILLRQELDEMAQASNGNFAVHYVLEKAPPGWTGEVGLVTKEMIQKYCPPPPASKDDSKSVKMFLCGPLLMVKSLTTFTNELGYHKPRAVSKIDDQVYKF